MKMIGLCGLVSLFSCCTYGPQRWDAPSKQAILNTLELAPIEGSNMYVDALEKDVTVTFSEVDLNGDSMPEIMVKLEGSLYLSGVTGSSIGIYQFVNGHEIKELLMFPAIELEVLSQTVNGYNVLKFYLRGNDRLWYWENSCYTLLTGDIDTTK